MKESALNIPASVQARLRNEAQQQGKPFAEILQYYAMERFLYRLSKSEYVSKFILKGGLLLYGWNIALRRPTRDIDFRGYLENSENVILKAVEEIIAVPVPNDGMEFYEKTVKLEQTQVDADYEGIRVKFSARLGNARIPMQIDIGFSDVLASKAERLDFPTLLGETKVPHLKGYPRESIISEKFHAIIRYAQLNSRFKDFYDIWLMAESFEFDGLSLQKAIEKTFANRKTILPTERPVGLTSEFAETNQKKWSSFLGKLRLEGSDREDFRSVINGIWSFLEYPLQASAASIKATRTWVPRKGWTK